MRNEQIAGLLNGHYDLVKLVGNGYLRAVLSATPTDGSFALAVVGAIDSLGNIGLALEQDAYDAWDAEAREIETAFEEETP